MGSTDMIIASKNLLVRLIALRLDYGMTLGLASHSVTPSAFHQHFIYLYQTVYNSVSAICPFPSVFVNATPLLCLYKEVEFYHILV